MRPLKCASALSLTMAVVGAATAVSPALANSPNVMMADCRARAAEVLRTRLPNIETKYEGQRVDGTHAVNGTARFDGRTETFQCSFNRPGNKLVEFKVNQRPHGGDGSHAGGRPHGGGATQLPSPPLGPNWVEIGRANVSLDVETDRISGRGEGRFTAIRLCVERRPVEFRHVEAVFGNGERQVIQLRRIIPAGDCTRVIDLDKGARRIRNIVLRYQTARERGGQAVIVVSGRHPQGNGPGAHGGGGGGQGMGRVETDCLRAVEAQVRKPGLSIISIDRGENLLKVKVRVPGARAPWICEHSTREVVSVYYGAEG